MFTLTKEEAAKKAAEAVHSFDIIRLPEYVHGRTDVARVSVVSSGKDGKFIFYFIVVWKNSYGLHSVMEEVPGSGMVCVAINPIFFEDDEEEIDTIVLQKVGPGARKMWLN